MFITLVLSFINIHKTAKIAQVLSGIGIVFSTASFWLSISLSKILSFVPFVSARFGIGSIICVVVLIFIFVLNKLIIVKNIQPEIKEIDLERVKIRKQIKNGELSYDDLTLPVLESEEEKEKRLQEKEEKEKLVQSAKGEGK